MKKLLLILMVLASVAMADNLVMAQDIGRTFFSGAYTHISRGGDAKMKALLVGTWRSDDERTFIFQSDGKWLIDGQDSEKWDIQGGKLIEIRSGFGAADLDFIILFLTNHEFLARENSHGQGYIFLTRQAETPD